MATRQDPVDTGASQAGRRNPAEAQSPAEAQTRYHSPHDRDGRDSAEIKRSIDHTRGAMDETLDELGQRLNPRNLLDDILDVFRSPQTQDTAKRAGGAASDFASNLGRQVRDNPVGATLVGAGLAWMAFGGRRDGDHDFDDEARGRYSPTFPRRALQDEYVMGGDVDPNEPSYYMDEELLLDDVGGVQTEPENLFLQTNSGTQADRNRSRESGSLMRDAHGEAVSGSSSLGDKASSAWDSTTDAAASAGHAVGDVASDAAGAVSDAAESVVDGVKSAASAVGSSASSLGSSSSEAARGAYLRSRAASRDAYRSTRRAGRGAGRYAFASARSSVDQLSAAYDVAARKSKQAHQEYPLAIGLGTLAFGALVGLMIPRTRREDEWMGEASDEAVDQAHRMGEQAYNRGREAVENTVATAKASAESQGLTGESLADRAARAVEKVVGDTSESISQAASKEGLTPEQLKKDAKAVTDDTAAQAKEEAEEAGAKAKSKAGEVDSDAEKAVDQQSSSQSSS